MNDLYGKSPAVEWLKDCKNAEKKDLKLIFPMPQGNVKWFSLKGSDEKNS